MRTIPNNTIALLHGSSVVDCYVLCTPDEVIMFGEQALSVQEFVTGKYDQSKPIVVTSAILNAHLQFVKIYKPKGSVDETSTILGGSAIDGYLKLRGWPE